MVCNCGLFICYQCLHKIELMVINNRNLSQSVPQYLDQMFIALRGRHRHIQICHGCFLRKGPSEVLLEKAGRNHVRASTSKYEGCLLFKEFGLLVDSNTIDIKGRTSVDVHGLGQETDSGAPLHCVIAPEVAQRFPEGRDPSSATLISECCKPSTCQSRFTDGF